MMIRTMAVEDTDKVRIFEGRMVARGNLPGDRMQTQSSSQGMERWTESMAVDYETCGAIWVEHSPHLPTEERSEVA